MTTEKKISELPAAAALSGSEVVPVLQAGADVKTTLTDILKPAVHAAGNQTITGIKTFSSSPVVPTPTAAAQAAPKSYVDGVAGTGASGARLPVKVVSLTNQNVALVALPGPIDGYQPVDGDRVLLVAQTTAAQNGIWTVSSLLGWRRPADFATGTNQAGAAVFVAGGSTRSGSSWVLGSTGTINVDSHAQTWIGSLTLVQVHGDRYVNVVDRGADTTGSAPAQAIIKAAYDSLTTGGTLRIPGGTYLLTDQLLLSGNRRVKIDSDGTSSILLFNAASALTDGLRIVDAGEFSLNGLRVRNTTGSATITNLVHYTTTASSQMCALRDLIIDPQATGITNKLAIGHDTFLDVAEVLLENVYCSGLASTGAAVVAGNHTAGNVINIRALSCFFGNAVYGVLIDGSVIQLTDCTLQGNSGADYKVITPGGAPIKIEGVRSEGSKRFFEYTENGEILGPLSLRDIRVDSFTDTDGHIVWIAGIAVTILEGWTVFGGPVAADFLITSPSAGAVVHARAILTKSSTPFPGNANVTVAWDTPHRYIDSGGLIAVAP